MKPFELLSELDKTRISNYINYYSFNGSIHQEQAALEYVLRFWNEAKNQFLFPTLFKDKLIIEMPIEYESSLSEIKERLFTNNIIGYGSLGQRIQDELYEKTSQMDQETKWLVTYLFEAQSLASNTFDPYSDKNYTFILANGKKYTVNPGAKSMKIIKKLCDSYGVTGYDDFQIQHSLALNQKKLQGTLCLSIHPLDYMTMSDNGCGWDSCMRWRTNGEYRQGTIEMMNSSNVIVAYLKSDKPWDFYLDHYTENQESEDGWNSKKWRCLFIVDENFSVSVKGYPYENDFLTKNVLQIISAMCGWGDRNPSYPFNSTYEPQLIGEKIIRLNLTTTCMYNDLTSSSEISPFITLNPNSTEDINDTDYSYSGKTECIWCGAEFDAEEGDEYKLVCYDCKIEKYCADCGERIEENQDYTELNDGRCYCSWCAEHALMYCDIAEETVPKDECVRLYIADKKRQVITLEYILISDYIWEDNHQAWSHFSTKETVERQGMIHYIYPEDLTEWGKTLFNLDSLSATVGEFAHIDFS